MKKKILATIFVLLSLTLASCNDNTTTKVDPSEEIKNNLISYVSFDALDKNGNFYDEITGNAFYTNGKVSQVDGKEGKAAKFNGSSSLELSDFTKIKGNQPHTMMCYVTADTTKILPTTNNVICALGLEKSNGDSKLMAHYQQFAVSSFTKYTMGKFPQDIKDTFHQVALTYDGLTMSLFVDGVSQSNYKYRQGLDLNGSSLYVGGYTYNSLNWIGSIDELYVFDKCLTKQEMNDYFNKTISFDVKEAKNNIPTHTDYENFSAKDIKPIPGMWNEFIYESEKANYKLSFKLYFPEKYDASKKYPLQIFLHGAMGNGCDVDTILNVHEECTTVKKTLSDKIESLIMVPVSGAGMSWTDVKGDDSASPKQNFAAKDQFENKSLTAVQEVLDDIEENLVSLDKNRIYLSGVSAGAIASYYLIAKYPNRFAGAIICAGRGAPENGPKLKDTPMWIFHGDIDLVLAYEAGYAMYQAIVDAGGTVAKFTKCEGYDHGISESYLKHVDDLAEWLYSNVNTRR